MAKEEIGVLDGACKERNVVVTRHGIEHEVSALLKRGLTTTSAGGFFFIPYMLQLRANDLLASLGAAKQQGIPNESIALGIIFESIFGFTAGIRAVDSVSRTDFGLLAGLPFLPSVSTQYRFLQDVPVQDGLDFQTKLGKQLISLGQVTPGFPVNVDGHNIKTFSRKAMKLSFLTKEDRYGKAIRTFYTQDQESKKPLIALAAYSGTTVSQVTRQLSAQTRDILGRDFFMVADKEWYCGQLIQELHQQYGVAVLTPMKSSTKRKEQFDAVPLDKYDRTIWGNIATLYTTMTNFDGPYTTAAQTATQWQVLRTDHSRNRSDCGNRDAGLHQTVAHREFLCRERLHGNAPFAIHEPQHHSDNAVATPVCLSCHGQLSLRSRTRLPK